MMFFYVSYMFHVMFVVFNYMLQFKMYMHFICKSTQLYTFFA